MSRLEVTDLARNFGGVRAVDGVSLAISGGDVVGLVGPNGSGKTTFVNMVTGYLRPSSGHVSMDGNDVTRWRPHRLAEIGIGRTFQVPRLFPSLTVGQNVEAALQFTVSKPLFWRGFIPGIGRSTELANRARAIEILDRAGIGGLVDRPAGEVSLGEARRIEIARALVAARAFLILDEPAAGLRGKEANEIGEIVREIANERGVGVLLIDHNVSLVRSVCSHLVVLDFGKEIASGRPAEVVRRPEVVEAYLGRAHA